MKAPIWRKCCPSLTQYLTGLGLAQTDDILGNTFGALAGFLLADWLHKKLRQSPNEGTLPFDDLLGPPQAQQESTSAEDTPSMVYIWRRKSS